MVPRAGLEPARRLDTGAPSRTRTGTPEDNGL